MGLLEVRGRRGFKASGLKAGAEGPLQRLPRELAQVDSTKDPAPETCKPYTP